eukprot:comp20289_c0_seq1/m.25459 comp20289_c0_seq1/g.25459  ORF comp20289_c0_seq1/g.25459 comp20289_c0_seq1/m.25459 type:complete len:547 (-) comp20289_c0_seq1:94-1734(-)
MAADVASSLTRVEVGEPRVDHYGFILQGTDKDDDPKTTRKARSREQKWQRMLGDWETYRTVKQKKLEGRCFKSVPESLRGTAWQALCGSVKLHLDNPGVYEGLLMKEPAPEYAECIEVDLHRVFPNHILFIDQKKIGQSQLRDVLRAYAVYNPSVGYCQAMGPVVAVLLMYMPAEEAFWSLVALLDSPIYLKDYYSPMLVNVQVDAAVLKTLMAKYVPNLDQMLNQQGVEPLLFMTDWFMCVFARTLPWSSVLRVWDMFFCQGFKICFRVALAIFKLCEADLLKLQGLNQIMDYLRNLPYAKVQPTVLVPVILKTKIPIQELESEHAKEVKAWSDKNAARLERQKVVQQNTKQPQTQMQSGAQPQTETKAETENQPNVQTHAEAGSRVTNGTSNMAVERRSENVGGDVHDSTTQYSEKGEGNEFSDVKNQQNIQMEGAGVPGAERESKFESEGTGIGDQTESTSDGMHNRQSEDVSLAATGNDTAMCNSAQQGVLQSQIDQPERQAIQSANEAVPLENGAGSDSKGNPSMVSSIGAQIDSAADGRI